MAVYQFQCGKYRRRVECATRDDAYDEGLLKMIEAHGVEAMPLNGMPAWSSAREIPDSGAQREEYFMATEVILDRLVEQGKIAFTKPGDDKQKAWALDDNAVGLTDAAGLS